MSKRNAKNLYTYILTVATIAAGLVVAWYLSQLFVPLSLIVPVLLIFIIRFIWTHQRG